MPKAAESAIEVAYKLTGEMKRSLGEIIRKMRDSHFVS